MISGCPKTTQEPWVQVLVVSLWVVMPVMSFEGSTTGLLGLTPLRREADLLFGGGRAGHVGV